MFNCLDRRRAITSRSIVPDESELHPATAEQMPRFKRMTKAEPASANLHSSGWTIGSRTVELNLLCANYGENVVRMLRNNSERVTRI
jgi:hypothetical protein